MVLKGRAACQGSDKSVDVTKSGLRILFESKLRKCHHCTACLANDVHIEMITHEGRMYMELKYEVLTLRIESSNIQALLFFLPLIEIMSVRVEIGKHTAMVERTISERWNQYERNTIAGTKGDVL